MKKKALFINLLRVMLANIITKKIELYNLMFNNCIMLLSDLVKLFSSQLNIDEERFINIIEINNINFNQQLRIAKNKHKLPNTTTNTTINSNNINNNVEKRSRGRPRKQCNIIIEKSNIPDDVNYEGVEEITHNSKLYYKTDDGAILDTNYNVQGLFINGQIMMDK